MWHWDWYSEPYQWESVVVDTVVVTVGVGVAAVSVGVVGGSIALMIRIDECPCVSFVLCNIRDRCDRSCRHRPTH